MLTHNGKNATLRVVIAEIFESIQGEGKYAGTPALFIRTGKCNLACIWCDTSYTWKKDETTYQKFSWDEILQKIASSKLRHFVITGGEPMLQQQFIAKVRHNFPDTFIEVETNGTIPGILDPQTVDQFNISPKLSNSENSWYKLNLQVPNCIYKFVVQKPSDIEEIENFIEQNNLDRNKIYLMPEGTSPEIIQKREKWIASICKEKNFHYTTRLHVLKNIR